MAGRKDDASFHDLDAVAAPDLRVQLDGVVYRLPGDPPSDTLLSLVVLGEKLDEAVADQEAERMLEIREEMAEQLDALFALRPNELPENGLTMSDVQLGSLIEWLFSRYYQSADDAETEGGGDRPTLADDSTPTTPPKRRNTKRSAPRSSARGRSAAGSKAPAAS